MSPSIVFPMHWTACPLFYKRPYKFKKIIETELNNIKVIIPDKKEIYNL